MIHKPTVNHIFDEKFKHGLDIIGLPTDLVALLATEPDVLIWPDVSLETLYQDPAATVLAGPGDPCGAVVHPITREVEIFQDTDAARPIVGIDGRSLIYDGESSYMISSNSDGLVPSSPSDDFSLVADVEILSVTGAQMNIISQYLITESDRTQWRISTGTGQIEYRIDGPTISAGVAPRDGFVERFVVAWWRDSEPRVGTDLYDVVGLVGTQSAVGTGTVALPTEIGRRAGNADRHLHGVMRTIVVGPEARRGDYADILRQNL